VFATRRVEKHESRKRFSNYAVNLTVFEIINKKVRSPMRSLDFLIYLILPALGSTQPLTEMSTRNLPGGKGRPVRKVDNLTAIREPTVYTKCGSLDV
jgi:hypothetical protein